MGLGEREDDRSNLTAPTTAHKEHGRGRGCAFGAFFFGKKMKKREDRLTHRKRVTEYPDLATSPQIEYLVLACEEGGRWGPDQHRLLRSLVRTKVASIHPLLRRRASLAYTRRWWGILSIGAQTVAADCILGRESPVPAPTSALPLASVLPLIDIGTEPSRMR